jgi:hypothetical protein
MAAEVVAFARSSTTFQLKTACVNRRDTRSLTGRVVNRVAVVSSELFVSMKMSAGTFPRQDAVHPCGLF